MNAKRNFPFCVIQVTARKVSMLCLIKEKFLVGTRTGGDDNENQASCPAALVASFAAPLFAAILGSCRAGRPRPKNATVSTKTDESSIDRCELRPALFQE